MNIFSSFFALRLSFHNLRFRKTEIDAEIAFESFADLADAFQDRAVRFRAQAIRDLLQRTLLQAQHKDLTICIC